jgi:hypothetical protein
MVFKAATIRRPVEAEPSRLLEPEEFCRLLLSRRRLVRYDTLGSPDCRLLDETNGELFNVEESKLDRYVEKEEEVGSE